MSLELTIKNDIGYVAFDMEDSKVNLLTMDMVKHLDGILDEVLTKPSLKALIIYSKKKDVFIAGADIKEIEGITEASDGEAKSKAGQDILNKLEDLGRQLETEKVSFAQVTEEKKKVQKELNKKMA